MDRAVHRRVAAGAFVLGSIPEGRKTAGNPYISTVLTTEDYGNTTQVQKKRTQALDQYGNVTQVQMFDYGNLTTPARTQNNTYLSTSNYTSRYIFNRLLTSSVTDGTNTASTVGITYDAGALTDQPSMTMHDSAYGTSFQYRGNATSTNTLTHSVSVTYDIGGNIVSATDNGVTTSTTVNSSTYYAAPSTLTTNSLATSLNWSPFLAPGSQTGPNGDTASISYDSNARPSTTTSPFGAVSTFTYNDTASPPTRYVMTAGPSGNHGVRTTLDGFGRTIKTETGTGTPTSFTVVSVVDTVYGSCGCSPIGKMVQTSMPYASGGTAVYTTYTYDGLGRTITKKLPDNSTTTYSYAGNTVTVTDPAGNWKTFTMNAFGNLISVLESDPSLGNVTTTYTYDILNHLTGVSMPRGANTQTRTFVYKSGTTVGGLLLSATNPENGTVTYNYNTDNTLNWKKDAKNQQTQYSYDSYKRVTQVRHYPVTGQAEDTSQQVNYYYDTNPYDTNHTFSSNTAGRLAAISYAAATEPVNPAVPQFQEWYSYLQAGAATKKRVHINVGTGANLDATYTYDNEGKMTSVVYPNSGPTFTYSFDSMSRPSGLTDQNNNQVVHGLSYGPANELLGITYFGQIEGRTYNNLLQLTGITGSFEYNVNLQYVYPTGTNNGKVSQQNNLISGEQVVYTYDSLNRLATAATSAAFDQSNPSLKWGQSFTYDGFGNLYQMNVTKGSAPTLSATVDPATNRLGYSGVTYDANGNTVNGLTGGGYNYDVENRMVSPGSAHIAYAYSPSNQRVWKGIYNVDQFFNWTLASQEVYFYGVDGKRLGTYSVAPNPPLGTSIIATELFVYFGQKMVGKSYSPYQPTTFVPFVGNRLGSNGDYYPYGQDKGTPLPNDEVKFATYTRDSATGLDYAMNRYYANSLGRFTSPDPFTNSGRLNDPQSWNRYLYTRGDPVNRFDPRGTDDQPPQNITIMNVIGKLDPAQYFPILPGMGGGSFYSNTIMQMGAAIGGLDMVSTFTAALWAKTLTDLANAAKFLSGDDKLASDPNSNCAKDLASIKGNGKGSPSASDIRSAADMVQFQDALTSTFPPIAGAGPPPIVGTKFLPGQYAGEVAPGDNQQYWMPGSTIFEPGTGELMTPGRLYGMVMHELLHNLGYDDTTLQDSLNLTVGPRTDNISIKLTDDCFK